uniref:Leucine-rich repeats and IQ motif containing 1 n=1 Tax=Anabas testudineus TaxID=64144 RepID=A0AAQ6ITA7_ANATE
MIDEEIKRIKEEEEKKKKEKEEKKKREEEDMKKREEEKIKRQMQRERMEEERRRANEEEENRKIKEIKEEEERRNKEEEQRKKKEEEEKRKREEEKNKMQKEIRKKEEERKKEIRLKEEEKRRQMEEEERKIKGMENNIKVKEKNKEEETMKKEQEKTVIKVTGKKMEGDKKRKNEEEESLDEEGLRKKEWRIRAEEDKTKEADVKIAEELEMKTQQEEKKEEGKSEEERKEAEIEKMMDKEMRKKEEKMSNIGNEVQLTENKEKRKKDVDGRHNIENKYRRMEEEKITKEEEWKKSQGEEMKRHKNVKDEYRKIEEEISLKEGNKTYEADKEKRHEHEKLEKDGTRKKEGGVINTEADERQMKEEVNETKAGNIKTEGKGLEEEEESKMIIVKETVEKEEKRANDLQEKNLIENDCTNTTDERNNTARTGNSLTSQLEDNSICTSSGPGPLYSDSISFETAQRGDQEMNIIETYTNKTMDQQDAAGKLCTSPSSLLWCLPEDTEQKRLSWMKYCIPWSKLSLQNRRKHKGSVRSQRLPRRAAEASSLPPLCPDTLLQSTVTLEDLPGCSLSTLVQCTQLRSLSLRRCGLKSLEGISQLSKLCYIDVEENEISFVNCENMTSLRVLRLGHNKLTSIHGLSGADNLDVLELSHNNITRIGENCKTHYTVNPKVLVQSLILSCFPVCVFSLFYLAGLESMRKLQRLSVDHNQLISTKGLRDVYTLLHLNCSHNHLTSVEGLENSMLTDNLTVFVLQPPSLDNHVLLRELHLDDNSISSLQCLTACWLPLMQHLSVAQNRITQLHSMSDFVSLAYLDLRFNCMSELQNVCKSLERCYFLKDLYLTGNPLQQESGWSPLGIGGFRSTLELHLSRNSPESRRVQTAEHSAIKRGVNMFYLSNGITHNIYVCFMIHGEVSTISFFGYLQAFWRGCSVRRRLASALAAVTYPSTREDDTFEEVDVDEFVFDEVCTQVHLSYTFMAQCINPHTLSIHTNLHTCTSAKVHTQMNNHAQTFTKTCACMLKQA